MVGGQALAFWVSRYGVELPSDVLIGAISDDADFLGTRKDVIDIARGIHGTPELTSLVLHTWQQALGRHVHLHALVAGGALAESGQWVAPKKGFLFPVRALSKVFRGKFVAGLYALRNAERVPE